MLNQLHEAYKLIGGGEIDRIGNINTVHIVGSITTVLSIIGVCLILLFINKHKNSRWNTFLLILYFFCLVLIISWIGLLLMTIIKNKTDLKLQTDWIQMLLRYFIVPLCIICILIIFKIPRTIDPTNYINYMANYLYQDISKTNISIKLLFFCIPILFGFIHIAKQDNIYIYYSLITGICSIIFVLVMMGIQSIMQNITDIEKLNLNNSNILVQSIVIFIVILTILSNITQRSEGLIFSSILQIVLATGTILNMKKNMDKKSIIISIVLICIMCILLVPIIYSTTNNKPESIIDLTYKLEDYITEYYKQNTDQLNNVNSASVKYATANTIKEGHLPAEPNSQNRTDAVVKQTLVITNAMKLSADTAILQSGRYLAKKLALLNAISLGDYTIKNITDSGLNDKIEAAKASAQKLLENIDTFDNIARDEITMTLEYKQWAETQLFDANNIYSKTKTAMETAATADTAAAKALLELKLTNKKNMQKEFDTSKQMVITANERVTNLKTLVANDNTSDISKINYFNANIDILSFSLSTMLFSGIYKFVN